MNACYVEGLYFIAQLKIRWLPEFQQIELSNQEKSERSEKRKLTYIEHICSGHH